MRLLPKLTMGILGASAVPLAIAGISAARLSEQTLRRRIEADHAALATGAADSVTRFFDGLTEALAVYPQLRDLESAPPEVTAGVLRLAYRSHEAIAIVALLDGEGGERVGSVYLSDAAAADELGGRPVASDADRDAFLTRVPLARALAEGRAVGEVALAGNPAEPRCAVAVSFTGARGRWVLAADVSLRGLHARLAELSKNGPEVILVDARRRHVAGGAGRPTLQGVALPGDKDPAGPLPQSAAVATVTPGRGAPALAAFSPASRLALGVVVTQPEATAFALVADLRRRTYYWVGVSAALALLVGVALARGVSRRIGSVSSGTVSLAQGKFDLRLDATGSDELAQLARSFNKMAADLGRAHDEIRGKNVELEKWNVELGERVEEKTRELKHAQEMLLRSQSLAALGTLGAGMAHEINNPLTGVIGAAQLLLMDLPEGSPTKPLIADIETQAQRIKKIVTNLLKVSQREAGAGEANVDLNRVLDDALELVGQEELQKAKIEVERKYEHTLPPVKGNPGKLQEAVIELLTNARRAMPQGGRLILQTGCPDQRVVSVRVSDTGKGISPDVINKIFDPFFTTKSDWTSTGMGLTMVHKIVEEHRGTIAVDSQVGRGATFTMTFPSAANRRHLD